MNTQLVTQLASEYLKDPNCRPELWIASENVTSEEKERFLSIVNDVKQFNSALDSLEK